MSKYGSVLSLYIFQFALSAPCFRSVFITQLITQHIKKILKSLGIALMLSHVFLKETSSILNGHPVLWQPTECKQTLFLLFMKFQSTSHSDKLIPQA